LINHQKGRTMSKEGKISRAVKAEKDKWHTANLHIARHGNPRNSAKQELKNAKIIGGKASKLR
jgi:hypothetical protein